MPGVRQGLESEGEEMTRGVDFSWARPGGAAIKAAGFGFVLRYVPYPGDGGKGLTVAEIADYRANGLDIGLVFESTAERPLAGWSAGRADALQCDRSLLSLNAPGDLPIYFAVDFDAQSSQFDAIAAYLRGAQQVLGLMRVGVYGSYAVIEDAHTLGSAAWFWQALAWSGGNLSPWRHLYQSLNGQFINGGEVDHNEAYGDDQGLWKAEEDTVTIAELAQRIERLEMACFAGGEQPEFYNEKAKLALYRVGLRIEGEAGVVAQSIASEAATATSSPQPGNPDHVHTISGMTGPAKL